MNIHKWVHGPLYVQNRLPRMARGHAHPILRVTALRIRRALQWTSLSRFKPDQQATSGMYVQWTGLVSVCVVTRLCGYAVNGTNECVCVWKQGWMSVQVCAVNQTNNCVCGNETGCLFNEPDLWVCLETRLDVYAMNRTSENGNQSICRGPDYWMCA